MKSNQDTNFRPYHRIVILVTEKCEQRAYPLPVVYAQQHRHRWTPLDGLGSWGAKHQTTLMNRALRPGWMTRRQLCINGCENEKTTTT